MTLHGAQSVFFFGIAGSGMKGLAYLLLRAGKRISGTDSLFTHGHAIPPGFKEYDIIPEQDPGVLPVALEHDLIVFSDALPENHPVRAQRQAIAYHEAVGQFSQQYTTVAVAGTHGKSSTTAFLAHILSEAGLDPTVLIGAGVIGWPEGNARTGKSNLFIVEADEYRHHFLSLSPAHAIVASIDFDHPDYFSHPEDSVRAYDLFLQRVQPDGAAVTSPPVLERYPDLSWPTQTHAAAAGPDTPAPIPGIHMQQNAALAMRMAEMLGVNPQQSKQLLKTFPGLQRRFERLYAFGPLTVISDYAHHPAEVAAALAAAREQYPETKLIALFEAHMYERLQAFLPEYVAALALADAVLLYPPFSPAGRGSSASAHTALFASFKARLSRHRPILEVSSAADIRQYFTEHADAGGVVIALSAGNLDAVLRSITPEA